MSRTLSLLVTALVLAASGPSARAQDASPPASQSANQSAPAQSQSKVEPPKAAAQSSAQANSSTQGGSQAAAGSDSRPPSKRVCFALSGRCVEPAKGTRTPGTGAGATGSSGQKGTDEKSLDLAAPDVRSVVPPEELKEPLPEGQEITEVQESQTVAVKGEGPGADVPLGFGAIWWALNHPSRAWRIFTPAE